MSIVLSTSSLKGCRESIGRLERNSPKPDLDSDRASRNTPQPKLINPCPRRNALDDVSLSPRQPLQTSHSGAHPEPGHKLEVRSTRTTDARTGAPILSEATLVGQLVAGRRALSRERKFWPCEDWKPSSDSGRGGGSPRPDGFLSEDAERAAG